MVSRIPPIVINSLMEHTATVIFLHGRGNTGQGWSSEFERGLLRLPHVKYILPTSPTRSITRFGGECMTAWYDTKRMGWDMAESVQDVDESRQMIFDLIDEEENRHGIPASRVVVAGFSMGAAMAIFSGLTYNKKLAGIVSLSGNTLQRDRVKSECTVNEHTPLFYACGDSDDVIPFKEVMERGATFLKEFHDGVEVKVYPGMGHSTVPQEIRDLKKFLERCIPPTTAM